MRYRVWACFEQFRCIPVSQTFETWREADEWARQLNTEDWHVETELD